MLDREKITALAEERMAELDKGLFIVDLRISDTNVISLEIDSETGGVSIDDCVRVSRNIEHNLDREEQDFELSVSSAGLDKPLRVLKQYPKNIGRELKVKTVSGDKVEGVLTEADAEGIVLQTSRKERIEGKKKKELIVEDIPLKYADIKEAKVVISFK
ncbi:ribosome assembly cofactor RimP [Wandonia haliotis]|uniref:Ribosome maturation factor RimP n=1 Tax=Wandonia haliotis TaxID=574963 RepID=A0ABN1MMH3_9FLAO